MSTAPSLLTTRDGTDFIGLGDVIFVAHDHTYTLAVERIVADVLGLEGTERRKVVLARSLARRVVTEAANERSVAPGGARFQLTARLFSLLGEGRFSLDTENDKRIGVADALLSSSGAALEESIRGDGRIDGYAAGWLAAGLEMALSRSEGVVTARERRTKGMPRYFDFGRDDAPRPEAPATLTEFAERVPEVQDTGTNAQLVECARAMYATCGVDQTGLRHVVGQLVCSRPASYYTQLISDAAGALDGSPEMLAIFRALLVEAAAQATLRLLVASSLSDEWELHAGGRPQNEWELASSVCAFARAAGWGRVAPLECSADRVVLVATPLVDDTLLMHGDRHDTRHLLEGIGRGLLRAAQAALIGEDPPARAELERAWGSCGEEFVTFTRQVRNGDLFDELVVERA